MKMKLGISFSALGLFFYVNTSTASRFFFRFLKRWIQKRKLGFAGRLERALKQISLKPSTTTLNVDASSIARKYLQIRLQKLNEYLCIPITKGDLQLNL